MQHKAGGGEAIKKKKNLLGFRRASKYKDSTGGLIEPVHDALVHAAETEDERARRRSREARIQTRH